MGVKILNLWCAFFLLLGGVASAAGQDTMTYKVGKDVVELLTEGADRAQSSLLIGADEASLKKYVPDGTYLTAVNAYLIRSPERIMLVDTGYGKKLFENLQRLNVSPDKVDIVLVTHMHGDHIGGLLKDGKPTFPNARVYVSKPESDYWGNAANMKGLPESRQGTFKLARQMLDAYGDRVTTFTPSPLASDAKELVPGVQAIAAFGHTPGHTMYLLHSGGDKLLFWGDLTHAMAIQMPLPGVALVYDSDPKAAVAIRQKVLAYVAREKLPVAGAHIPIPGMGGITSGQSDGYVFTPMK